MPTKLMKKTDSPTSKMGLLLEQEEGLVIPQSGDLVEGTIVAVGKREVRVDLPGFTTGVVRGRELVDESGEYSELKVGDHVTATVLDLENENGELELSFRHAGHQKAWGFLE